MTDYKVVADSFKELIPMIKSGEVTIEQVKEQMSLVQEEYKNIAKTIADIYNNVPNDSVDEITKLSIKRNLEKTIDEYDRATHEKDLKYVIDIMKTADKSINEDIFYPFIVNTLESFQNVLSTVHKESYEVVNNFLEKEKEYYNEKND